MIIKVRVSAGAKTEEVKELETGLYKVRVSAPPEKGRANQRVLELIAKHFGVSISQVFLKSGGTSRDKVVEVDL